MQKLKNELPLVTDLLLRFSVPNLLDLRREKGIGTLEACIRFDYPRLCDVKASHGAAGACLLIEVFVVNLNDACNVNRMQPEQITETAELIYEEGYFLKITELSEFFVRMKKASYGAYYGSLDCVKIMDGFRQFLRDRAEAAGRTDAKRRRLLRELYLEKNRANVVPMPDDFMSNVLGPDHGRPGG